MSTMTNRNLDGPQPELVLIQYPGIIKNVDKALETLGGLQTISQNHMQGRALELRHTPTNPYASCLISEKKLDANVTSGTMRLVMKIRRKKSDPKVMQVECLGLVNVVYTFEAMCDFQYLPIRLRAKNREEAPEGLPAFDDLLPRLIPGDLASSLCWWDRPDPANGYTPLFLPPYQFSRYNTPSSKILCRETDFGIDKTKRKTGHGQNLRVERKALSVTVMALDPFPEAPTEEAILDAEFRCKNNEPHRLLEDLFEERPMWTRVAIQYKTGLDDALLRSLLQKFAFYIQSGPWGRLWCKFGYDPRKEESSKAYQTLMVSFRQLTKIPERQRLKVSADRGPNSHIDNMPINFIYQPGRLPRVRQMWYSICDIHLPYAEELCRREASLVTDPATKGWINPDVIEELREQVKDDVHKTAAEMELEETGVDEGREIDEEMDTTY